MHRTFAALICLMPVAAFAVGSDSEPPKPTETTLECTDGTVWDEATKACVAPEQSSLDDDALYQAAREFAWSGQYENALRALAAMSDPREDRVLTYMGFSLRKSGDMDRGMAYYQAALEANPDNLLARSYMGQGFVELGATEQAEAQLAEIRARGGEGSWPEIALVRALEAGFAIDY